MKLLIDVQCGTKVRIISFQGGKGVQAKLRQLCILPGECVKVVKRAPFHGPIMIETEGRSVALGRGVAAKIEVEEVEECE
jgi:ferrous iron transport protein A